MDKEEFKNRIKSMENEETQLLFGKIDVDHICKCSLASLYYLFPLIERIIIEIFNMIPESNVEVLNQGTYKSVNEILDCNENVLDEWATLQLKEYYANDGARNTIFHNKNFFNISFDFEQIGKLLIYLLEKYLKMAENLNNYRFISIEEVL